MTLGTIIVGAFTLISFVAIERWYTFGAVDKHCAQGLVPLR